MKMALFSIRGTRVLSGSVLKLASVARSVTCLNITQNRTCVSCGGGAEKPARKETDKNDVVSQTVSQKNKVEPENPAVIQILGEHYGTDSITNVTPRVLSKLGRNLHKKEHHPLNLIHQRIKNFVYANYQVLQLLRYLNQ